MLLMKLCGFMIIVGIQAPGRLKWVCIFLLISYYFYTVYSLYNDHFEQQRRLLNLNPANNRPAAQRVQDNQRIRQFVAILADQLPRPDQREEQARRQEDDELFARLGLEPPANAREPGFEPLTWLYRTVSLALRLIYYFFLAGHHDWIEPVLRDFDN